MQQQATIIIPAYQPTIVLQELIAELQHCRSQQSIFVIDDGSTLLPAKQIFSHLHNVQLIQHSKNLGKGQALKTGFQEYLFHTDVDSPGVVTADADGQHTVSDIIKICEQLEKDPLMLHLGARHFSTSIPLRSKIGNHCTRFIVKKWLKIPVCDTQTGLRGIPRSFLPHLLSIPSKGYEFEMEMLLAARQHHVPIQETPISTIYYDKNRSSHFKPLKDSFKIYRSLLLSRHLF